MDNELKTIILRLYQFFSLIGIIIIIYLIFNGFKLNPGENFLAMSFLPVFIVLWIFAPRGLPFLWLASIQATLVDWVIYIFFGMIIIPRMTWGFIILQFFPPANQTVGWIFLVIGLVLDAIEDSVIKDVIDWH